MDRRSFTAASSVLLLVLATACGGMQPPGPPDRNLRWIGGKDYLPPPATTIVVSDLGINGPVDILPSGALPITVSRWVHNQGSLPVDSGYTITDEVHKLVFLRTAGSVGWTAGPAATQTLFTCQVPGPALAGGDSALVVFAIPGPLCTQNPAVSPVPMTVLPCGMYRQVLTLDAGDVVQESVEFDNVADHFFFVPSSDPVPNIDVALNPGADPNLRVVPVSRVEIRAFDYPPGAPVTARTHRLTVTTAPAGGGFSVHGRTPVRGVRAPDVGRLNPPTKPPLVVMSPSPVAGTVVDYDVTFDPGFRPPPDTGVGGFLLESLDTKLTVISEDGCRIRQESVLVTVVHR